MIFFASSVTNTRFTIGLDFLMAINCKEPGRTYLRALAYCFCVSAQALKEAQLVLVVGDQHILGLTVVGQHHLVILPSDT